jgi:hypothetical protein
MTRLSREEAEALLVFYANGSLDSEERDLVTDALEGDAALRHELFQINEMRNQMQAAEPANPGETAFYRLMKDVEKTPQESAETTSEPSSSRVSVLRVVLVVAVVAMLAQGAILWRGLSNGFDLASGSPQADLIVAFRPDAKENEIRELLLDLDLQIVSGPSSLGLYRLAGENPGMAVEALQSNPKVVESAENANE